MRSNTHGVTASSLLNAWEKGEREHPLQRGLTLLQLAEPDASMQALAELSLGECNRRLFALRGMLIGSLFEAVAPCPACGEQLEMSFTAEQIVAETPDLQADSITIEHGGYTVRVRLPTNADLLSVI